MSTIKISELTSSGAILGNVLVPIVGNIAGTLTTIKSTVDQLKTFIVASAEANILAANSATIFANTIMKNYVDLANTIQSAQLTSANIGIIGYVNLANTIQSAQIASANLGIVGYVDNAVSTANIGIKGYVDSVASQSIYGNGNVTSYTVAMGFTNYSNVNTKAYAESMGYQNFGNVNVAAYVTTANSAVVGYVDNAVSTANIGMNGFVNAVIDAVNVANIVVTQSIVSANLGLKGYVDSVATLSIYGNSNVASYLPTHTGNIKAMFANITGPDLTGLDALVVGTPGIETFGNIISQFHGNVNNDLFLAVHNNNPGNLSACGFMATSDIGDEQNYRLAMGITSSAYNRVNWLYPLDSFLLGIGGNLLIGTANFNNDPNPIKDVVFILSGNTGVTEVARISVQSDLLSGNLELGSGVGLLFNDGTRQTSAYSNVQVATYLPTYTGNVSFTMANTAHWTSNVTTISDAINQLAERIYNIENP